MCICFNLFLARANALAHTNTHTHTFAHCYCLKLRVCLFLSTIKLLTQRLFDVTLNTGVCVTGMLRWGNYEIDMEKWDRSRKM